MFAYNSRCVNSMSDCISAPLHHSIILWLVIVSVVVHVSKVMQCHSFCLTAWLLSVGLYSSVSPYHSYVRFSDGVYYQDCVMVITYSTNHINLFQ
jgi:hypothetical protein